MPGRFKAFTNRVKSIFTRRAPRSRSRSITPNSANVADNAYFYLATPVEPSSKKRKNTLYIFKSDQMHMVLRYDDSLKGAKVSGPELPTLINTHLNTDCFAGKRKSVSSAIESGNMIQLSSRTFRDAYAEARLYKAVNCKIVLKDATDTGRTYTRKNKMSPEWS